MLAMIGALTQLLQIWWTKDRIRVARSEGLLFRIRVGDRLLIDNKIFIVTHRVERHSSVAEVEYRMEEFQANSELVWRLSFRMRSTTAILSRNCEAWEIQCNRVNVLMA